MTVLDVRNAIAARLKATVPGMVTCEPHGGTFNAGELDRYVKNTPAAFVVCLGVADVEDDGGPVVATYRWTVFLLARDRPRIGSAPPMPKHDVGLVLANAVLGVVATDDWGGNAATSADKLRAENLYSDALDEKGATLWAVSWEQGAVLLPGVDDASLSDFLRLHTDYDLDPADGSVDAADTTEVRS